MRSGHFFSQGRSTFSTIERIKGGKTGQAISLCDTQYRMSIKTVRRITILGMEIAQPKRSEFGVIKMKLK